MDDSRPLTDLRDLLLDLPRWDHDRRRRSFAEQALGRGHRALDDLTWSGAARDVAWDLASACADYADAGVAHRDGCSPACALLAEAAERFADCADLTPRIAALRGRFGCPEPEPDMDWELDPYPGMAAFDFDQAPIFFGREVETRALLGKLAAGRGRRLLLVAGRSGSGKSSLVRAGLWAALAGAGERPLTGDHLAPLAGCEHWAITAMKPAERDNDPFRSLVDGIRNAGLTGLRQLDVLAEARALRDDPGAFATVHRRLLAGRPAGTRWLLIVDQFEELFTGAAKALGPAFLDRLLAALDLGRFGIVAAVRSDFLDACIGHPGLRAEMNDGDQFNLDAPDAGGLRAMVTGPLRVRRLLPERRAGIDDALVERLVRDASGESGGLALLAFALKDLYDRCLGEYGQGRRDKPLLRLADYQGASDDDGAAAGREDRGPPSGLHRIIRERAEAAVARAGVDIDAVLPRVFSRLVTVQPDTFAATRLRADLDAWQQDAEARRLIDALTDRESRLLSCGSAGAADAPQSQARGRVVEVAHEALFRAWPALAEWIERFKDALMRRPIVLRDAADWDAAGRPDSGIPSHMLADLRRLFDAAELWADMAEDHPRVAHYLAQDDAAELEALAFDAHAARIVDPAARGRLLYTLTRAERGAETLIRLVEGLREQDASQGTDVCAWLAAGIDIDALFAGPDATRWHWHRVAVGDLLDALGDRREGIGVDAGGLPDIAWHQVPAGTFVWQDGQERSTGAFRIARYPITNTQYRAFVSASDYRERVWWPRGVYDAYEYKWMAGNRPRVAMNWLEALAFCRWLTARLRKRGDFGADREVRLPTEIEWEKAARGPDGRELPWGEGYDSGAANIDETLDAIGELYLRQTTAVGLYPKNSSPYGLKDCAGNVWEWCLNKYDDIEDRGLAGDDLRAVRGGSWSNSRAAARAACRYRDNIDGRGNALGFRVCSACPIR